MNAFALAGLLLGVPAELPEWVTFERVEPSGLVTLSELVEQAPVVVVARNPRRPCCAELEDGARVVVLWVPDRSRAQRPTVQGGAWLAVDRHGLAAHQLGLDRDDLAVILTRRGEVGRVRLDRPGGPEQLRRRVSSVAATASGAVP
jgi:hypothetical protein